MFNIQFIYLVSYANSNLSYFVPYFVSYLWCPMSDNDKENNLSKYLIIKLNVVGYSMDSSPIGSWPSNPSFNWRIQAIQRSVEGFSEAALGPWAAHPGGRGPAPLPKILRPIVESLEFAN